MNIDQADVCALCTVPTYTNSEVTNQTAINMDTQTAEESLPPSVLYKQPTLFTQLLALVQWSFVLYQPKQLLSSMIFDAFNNKYFWPFHKIEQLQQL